jgi:predicted nucleic acid-binding protein
VIVDRTTLIFFDASCIVAACGSPTGGSGFVLSLCRRQLLRGAASYPVLEEAARNIASHFEPAVLARYFRLTRDTPLTIVPAIDETVTAFWSDYMGEKDAHVTAAAEAIDATYLLTLDKRLAAGVRRSGSTLYALSPGEFINAHLIHHPDREGLRDGQSL